MSDDGEARLLFMGIETPTNATKDNTRNSEVEGEV
jgi:hypothetical protein